MHDSRFSPFADAATAFLCYKGIAAMMIDVIEVGGHAEACSFKRECPCGACLRGRALLAIEYAVQVAAPFLHSGTVSGGDASIHYSVRWCVEKGVALAEEVGDGRRATQLSHAWAQLTHPATVAASKPSVRTEAVLRSAFPPQPADAHAESVVHFEPPEAAAAYSHAPVFAGVTFERIRDFGETGLPPPPAPDGFPVMTVRDDHVQALPPPPAHMAEVIENRSRGGRGGRGGGRGRGGQGGSLRVPSGRAGEDAGDRPARQQGHKVDRKRERDIPLIETPSSGPTAPLVKAAKPDAWASLLPWTSVKEEGGTASPTGPGEE